MDHRDDAADRLKAADEAAIRQAMVSMLLMLAFVGAGFGLAAYGTYHVWRSGSTAAAKPDAPAAPGSASGSEEPAPNKPSIPTGPVAVEVSADVAQQIELLIEQLGAAEYKTRQRASKALAEYGERARPALERALGSSDTEVRERARSLLTELDAARSGR